MKKRKLLAVLLLFILLLGTVSLTACGKNKDAETNAKSLLNSAEATCSSEDEPVSVSIKKISLLKTQTAHNHEYSYFLVKTDSYDWGYAELCDGEVVTFAVGYSRSVAKTRCEDLADYRTSKLGGIGQ